MFLAASFPSMVSIHRSCSLPADQPFLFSRVILLHSVSVPLFEYECYHPHQDPMEVATFSIKPGQETAEGKFKPKKAREEKLPVPTAFILVLRRNPQQ